MEKGRCFIQGVANWGDGEPKPSPSCQIRGQEFLKDVWEVGWGRGGGGGDGLCEDLIGSNNHLETAPAVVWSASS